MTEIGFNLPFILLAEDDDNDAFGTELAFKKAELAHRMRRVCDGQQAIDYLSGQGDYSDRVRHPTPSLLLMDWKMPRKSGFDVLQWLRAHPSLQHLVVVILTGSSDEADKKQAYEMRANSYLVKPSSFQDFVRLLKMLEGYWSLNQVPDRTGDSHAAALAP